jgi:hypothetical protein
MPLAAIPAIAALVSTAFTVYEETKTPSKPNLPTSVPSTPLTSGQNAQTKAAVGQQLPTLQALTGGSVSPEYAAQFGATQGGVGNNPQAAGDVQAAVNQFFGLSAPGSSGLTTPTGGTSPGGNPILDLISKIKPSGGGGDYVNNQLGGDDFRGLAG